MDLYNEFERNSIGISVNELPADEFLALCEEDTNVEKNIKQAIQWFKLATELGFAQTMYYIGNCYEEGNGVEQDYELALQWYKHAMEHGEPQAFSRVGVFYEEGLVVEKDIYHALKLYRKASDLGDEYAQKRLGWYDYQGISAPLSLDLIIANN